ncbi:D-alanyl-D-alanine carboxypeptidase family protein, partial [Methylogaea oryzae]
MPATAKRIPLILCLCLMSGVSFAKGHHQAQTAQPVAKHKPAKAAARSHGYDNPDTHAALVIDTANNAVLHAHNAGEPWYPASLTKMMTAFMAFDAMEAGRLSPDDTLTVSYHAAEQKGSRLGLRAGERITVDDAIRGLIARSANDAAVTLAEHIGGNEGDFAAAMTNKAHQIGMSHSSFENATGLPAPHQITTAHDMAVLAQTLIRRFPSQYHYFQTDSMTFHRRTMGAINPLLRSYPGAEGMKTGFTCASGYNIVGAAKRDGRRLIAVYLGGG